MAAERSYESSNGRYKAVPAKIEGMDSSQVNKCHVYCCWLAKVLRLVNCLNQMSVQSCCDIHGRAPFVDFNYMAE